MRKKIAFVSLCLLIFNPCSFSQNLVIDSLQSLLKSSTTNSIKIKLHNNIANEYYTSNLEKGLEHARQAFSIAKADHSEKEMAESYHMIAAIFTQKGNYSDALQNDLNALKIWEQLSDDKGIAASCNGISVIYKEKKNYSFALTYQLKSIELYKKLKDEASLISAYNNIGTIYKRNKQFDKALEYYSMSLRIAEAYQNKKAMAVLFNNIGNIYEEQKKYVNAIEFQMRSLEIKKETGNIMGISSVYNNLGNIYEKCGDYAKAIKFQSEALAIGLTAGNKKAIRSAYEGLSSAYSSKASREKKISDYDNAIKYYRLFTAVKDSMMNTESSRQIAEMQTKYETDKKEKEIFLQKAQLDKKETEIKWQTTQRNAFIAGFSLMLALAGVSYRSYRQKKNAHKIISEQKTIVENQKALVEERNKDITDSINYAKRLQEAILPPQKLIKQYLPDFFILYKPKDIVAGDFYWMAASASPNIENNGSHTESRNIVLIAAADCTGHGVPGAMVSVVCSNALNRTVKEFGETEPGKILDKVTGLVLETFEKSESEIKDGMDISLCALNNASGEVSWAGANNPLWIIRKDGKEVEERKPDKQPVGKSDHSQPFTTHKIQMKQGDIIYLFTDGYADQFGGEKGKKFKYSKLKELLLSIQSKSMNEQKEILNETFEAWKGNLEQVDDVCVIGIRV